MAEANVSLPLGAGLQEEKKKAKAGSNTLVRVAKYTGVRILSLSITVLIGLYLTIIIANMGGYVDEIRRAQIKEDVMMRVANDPGMRNVPVELKRAKIDELVLIQEQRYGMDRPFITRSATYLTNAVTLDLGYALKMNSNSGSKSVRNILLERLPPTLLLFASADIILFFLALFFALVLSRQYGSISDKILITLTPLSSAPGWFYGIFLILIFASILRILPFGGMVDAPPPPSLILYLVSLFKHMMLPVLALTLSQIFLQVFSWRTFFLIYSSEDYVDMAKAKGLTSREIERKYILRPTLPTIITSFALLLIVTWTGAPILETIFSWPGLGRTLFQAVGQFDTPVIIGETVIYSYLLALTVFLLDFIYALVDPRVKIGGEKSGI
jgi:peptide/nickel transport system permease protein